MATATQSDFTQDDYESMAAGLIEDAIENLIDTARMAIFEVHDVDEATADIIEDHIRSAWISIGWEDSELVIEQDGCVG